MNVDIPLYRLPRQRSVTVIASRYSPFRKTRERDTLTGHHRMPGRRIELWSHDRRIEPLRIRVVEVPLAVPRRGMRDAGRRWSPCSCIPHLRKKWYSTWMSNFFSAVTDGL